MSRSVAEKDIRKSVGLPAELWAAVEDYRFSERIKSEAEVIRRLLLAGLAAESRRLAKRRKDAKE